MVPQSIRIAINKSAPKTGRPRGKVAQTVRSTAKGRKEYYAFKKMEDDLHHETLRHFWEEIQSKILPAPGRLGMTLHECRNTVERIPKRYASHKDTKPTYGCSSRVTLSKRVMYMLPLDLVRAATTVFLKKGRKVRIDIDCSSGGIIRIQAWENYGRIMD